MLTIEQVDTQSEAQARRFVQLPFRLYRTQPQWVPPLRGEVEACLKRAQFPFYEHSDADFFIAVRDEHDVGRIAVLEHRLFNQYRGTRQAWFCFFDCEDEPQVAQALFEQAFRWARARNLTQMVGPKGFTMLDGAGLLLSGFDYRQVMSMTTYNHEYYVGLIEGLAFEKSSDFFSYHLALDTLPLPAWLHDIAEGVRQQGNLDVQHFSTLEELLQWAPRLMETFQRIFIHNAEHTPGSEQEMGFLMQSLAMRLNPHLVKAIRQGEEVVGVIFGFPNLSQALQRTEGQLSMSELAEATQSAPGLVFNGFGILPAYRLQGVDALLFSELEKTIQQAGIQQIDILRIAETTKRLRHDLEALGMSASCIHRIYVRDL